jgi:hypothetical protein
MMGKVAWRDFAHLFSRRVRAQRPPTVWRYLLHSDEGHLRSRRKASFTLRKGRNGF